MPDDGFVPLNFERLDPEEQLRRVREYHDRMTARRTVREFADEPVAIELIEWALRAAGSSPSGANIQPWHFAVVGDLEVKRKIREAAEREERHNYEVRFPDEWKAALAPLGTDWRKEFLEMAPWVIVVFAVTHPAPVAAGAPAETRKHYYVSESVGIAVGFLLSALHLAGLVTLTHTPSPMGFLREILNRPANERAYVVIPVGYPREGARVPDIGKKRLDEIMTRL